MKALQNYVIVEMKKQTTTTKKTESGLYLYNQERTDTTKEGAKVVTTDITVIDIGPDVKLDIKVGDKVALNYYELQILPEVEGHIYGVIQDKEIKVVY